MRTLVLLLLAVASLSAAPRELIVVSGGPAMFFYEKSRENPHDKHWGNFIDSAVVRLTELKKNATADETLCWLVFRPSYIERGQEMKTDLLADIVVKANRLQVPLLWFDSTDQLINYLNRGKDRKLVKIRNFDFFGHSNKACLLFDYSNVIDGMSTAFLHVKDLTKIEAAIFSPDAKSQSWGCHSGELYSQNWKKAFGISMIGAIGKTDYSRPNQLPFPSSEKGRWSE